MNFQANIYQFVDAGLALPPRQEAQNGFVCKQMENGLINGFSVPEHVTHEPQPSNQTNIHESSNGKENRTDIENEKLERLSENHKTPTQDPRSRFEEKQLSPEEPTSHGKQVSSPHSVTRRLRLEEAGSLLKPPPGSESYSVQGLRKFILGSSSPELDKSCSGPPPDSSKSEKCRSILDHLRPPFSKSNTKCSSEGEEVGERRKEDSKDKELPLSCGQLALVGELPSALLNLPTTAELLGEQGGEVRGVAEDVACSYKDYSGDEKGSDRTTDIKQSEPHKVEVLGHNDPLLIPNGSAVFTKDSSLPATERATDAGRPKKVTLVRKKSLSENCLLPKARVQRRDGQVTTSQTLCGDEVVPVRNQMASSRLDDSFLGDQIQVNGRHWEVNYT